MVCFGFLQCTAVSYLSCFLELSALLSFSVFVLPTMLIFQVSYGFAHANLLSDSASLVSLIVWVFHCRSSNSIFPHRLATVFRGSLHFLAVSFQHFRKAWTLTVLFFRRARLRVGALEAVETKKAATFCFSHPLGKSTNPEQPVLP